MTKRLKKQQERILIYAYLFGIAVACLGIYEMFSPTYNFASRTMDFTIWIFVVFPFLLNFYFGIINKAESKKNFALEQKIRLVIAIKNTENEKEKENIND